MIIGTYESNLLIKNITDIYLNLINRTDCITKTSIFFSNNMKEDYYMLTNKASSINFSGLTIPPTTKKDKIIVLIDSSDINFIFNLIHELTHACDMIDFAKLYCQQNLHEIEQHPLYQVFVYWMEFHVKLYDLPFSNVVIDYITTENTNTKESYENFIAQIPDFYYPKITEKILKKNPVSVAKRDIMYYLGEIISLNIHDKNHEYDIDNTVILRYSHICDMKATYFLLQECLNLHSFSENIQVLSELLLY